MLGPLSKLSVNQHQVYHGNLRWRLASEFVMDKLPPRPLSSARYKFLMCTSFEFWDRPQRGNWLAPPCENQEPNLRDEISLIPEAGAHTVALMPNPYETFLETDGK